jgi:ketosteroid isomerase-like protein
MPRTNRELVQGAYVAWNAGDLDWLLEVASPDIKVVTLVSDAISPGPSDGHEAVRRVFAEAQSRWSEFTIDMQEIVERGPHVVGLVRVTLVSNEREVRLSGEVGHVLTFADDLVIRFEAFRERADALRAAGVA